VDVQFFLVLQFNSYIRTAPVSYYVLSSNGIETCLEHKQVGPDSKEGVSSLSVTFDLFLSPCQ
jgi:hypothetical protein